MGTKGTLGAATVIAGAVRNAPKGRTWGQRIKSIPAMIKATLTGRWTGVSRFGVLLSLLGLAYVISPLDVVPDFLLPFGLVDDLGIAAVSVAYLVSSVDAYLDREYLPFEDGGNASASSEVIEGVVIRHDGK